MIPMISQVCIAFSLIYLVLSNSPVNSTQCYCSHLTGMTYCTLHSCNVSHRQWVQCIPWYSRPCHSLIGPRTRSTGCSYLFNAVCPFSILRSIFVVSFISLLSINDYSTNGNHTSTQNSCFTAVSADGTIYFLRFEWILPSAHSSAWSLGAKCVLLVVWELGDHLKAWPASIITPCALVLIWPRLLQCWESCLQNVHTTKFTGDVRSPALLNSVKI